MMVLVRKDRITLHFRVFATVYVRLDAFVSPSVKAKVTELAGILRILIG